MKTSKGMILNSQSKLQSDLQFVLIDIDDESSTKLIESVDQNLVFIDAVSKQTNWIKSSLDQLGLAPGCYLISDLRNQTDINVTNLINGFSPIRQYGYQVGIIADINQLSDLDDLNSNQVYLINSGKDNQMQDALLRNDEITDYSGKLSKGMSVGWQRDYTNVDVSNDHVGYVGMGQDTLLKGGRGFGYSTNGKDFNTVISPKGIVFRRPDAERMWRLLRPKEIEDINNTVGDKVQQEVDSATAEIPNIESTANEAVKRADSAVAASKANSDAQIAMSSAITAAQDGVNSATAAIQQATANAASDAAKIRADVAKVENEVANAKSDNQDSVNALQSDIDATKKDLAGVQSGLSNAQAAVEQNQKLINDSVAKINNDIEQDRKDLAAAQQANSDTATQLKDYAKQAAGQGKTIKILQDDDSSMKATIADINGNVSQVQDSVSGLSASLKDTQGNLATVKGLADSLNATITDHSKNISALQATAQSLSSTLSDASGRLSKVEQTAQEHSVTIGNLRSEVEWEQVSNSSLDTMKSAGHFWGAGIAFAGKPGSIKDTDQVRVVVEVPSDNSISQVLYANNVVWQRSFNGNTWSEWVRSANQGDVDTLQGSITQVKQTADGLTDTLKDAQGGIATVQATAKGLSEQVTNAQGAITDLQTDVTGIKSTIADNENDIHTLQADAKSLTDDMTDAQGNISDLQKTSTSLTSEMQDHSGRLSKVEQTASTLTNEFSDQQGRLSKVEQTASGTQQTVSNQQGQINSIQTDVSGVHETITGQGKQIADINVTLTGLNSKYEGVSGDLNNLKSQAQWVTITDTVDLNNIKTPCNEFLKGAVTNAPNEVAWWYLTVEGSEGDRITQTVIADQSNNRYTRRFADSWSAWVRDATQTDVTALSNSITTNSTQITQNKQAIALKADQSTVDNLSGEVSQNTAQLKVQADQISSKVSSADFGALNDRFNNMQIGGRNLLTNTDNDISVTSHITDGWPAWANIDTGFSFEHGKTYTFSAEATNSTDKIEEASIRVFEWRTNTQVGVFAFPADGERHSVTFTIPNDSHDYHLLLYAGHAGIIPGVDVTTTYHHSKLEFGNVATDWAPAPEDTITAIQKNSTAIEQNSKVIALKVDQTTFDALNKTVTDNSAAVSVLNDEIKLKVDTTTVNKIVDGKGFATTNTVQSLVDQKAGQISQTITDLKTTVDGNGNAISAANDKISNLTQAIDGIQTTVKDKADQSQITQLSNQLTAKVSANDYQTEIAALEKDLNLRVQKGDLISQINLEAGNTLIQSGKIYLDANTIVFGENSKAIIPSAAIGEIDASKITTGSISVPMSDAKGKATVKVEDGKVIITGIGPGIDQVHSSLTPFDPDYIGQSDITIDHEGLSFDATTDIWNGHPGTNKALGVFRPTSLDTADTAGISYIVKNFSSEDGPKNAGDYCAIDRQGLGEYQYIHGIVYKASEDHGSVHLGTHFYDPVYIHPYGAETGIRSTWCSWSSMGNRKFPVLVNSDHGWSGIAFPVQGPAFIFSNNGYVARPNQKIGNYNGYGDGNNGWYDPTDPNQAGQTIDYSKWA